MLTTHIGTVWQHVALLYNIRQRAATAAIRSALAAVGNRGGALQPWRRLATVAALGNGFRN